MVGGLPKAVVVIVLGGLPKLPVGGSPVPTKKRESRIAAKHGNRIIQTPKP